MNETLYRIATSGLFNESVIRAYLLQEKIKSNGLEESDLLDFAKQIHYSIEVYRR